ncbi:hypothetical protein SAMN03097699_2151 [Flavobacteriaceae bacterium MAR_2010_188]|nr:hypothetical protein SAMN03097699_2151 [Flavobacteriaceae bacterium MAR_2010_188]
MRFVLLFFIISSTSCQKHSENKCDYIKNYYQLIYQADIEYHLKNFDKAFNLYQQAFISCEPINVPTINELGNFAEVCAILGKNDLAIQFIKKQLERGFDIKWLLQDPNYDKLFSSEEGKEFLAEYDYLRETALSNLNLDLRKDIQDMTADDQKYRGNNYQENIDKQDAIDEKNTQRIIEIFDQFGYPTEFLIGGYGIDDSPANILGILLHTSDSIRINYFVPKLKKFVRNGECPPMVLGNIIDQYHLYNGEPQIYGTYGKQGGGYADMIKDLKIVDSNRVSIGLPPLRLKEKKDSILMARHPTIFK